MRAFLSSPRTLLKQQLLLLPITPFSSFLKIKLCNFLLLFIVLVLDFKSRL